MGTIPCKIPNVKARNWFWINFSSLDPMRYGRSCIRRPPVVAPSLRFSFIYTTCNSDFSFVTLPYFMAKGKKCKKNTGILLFFFLSNWSTDFQNEISLFCSFPKFFVPFFCLLCGFFAFGLSPYLPDQINGA